MGALVRVCVSLDPIDLTWHQGRAMRLVNPQIMRYRRSVPGPKGKPVEQEIAYTVVTMRPATDKEVSAWRDQPFRTLAGGPPARSEGA